MISLGIVVGAYVAGDPEPFFIISAGLSASLAMGLSGFGGAYVTEGAERRRELESLERSMLKNLESSVDRQGKPLRIIMDWNGKRAISCSRSYCLFGAVFLFFSLLHRIRYSIIHCDYITCSVFAGGFSRESVE